MTLNCEADCKHANYFEGKDYFQFQFSEKDPGDLEKLQDLLSENVRVNSFVIARELGEQKGLHYNGVIVHSYAQRKSCMEFINKIAIDFGLDGKKHEFGCTKQAMRGDLHANIKYVMKGQCKPDSLGYVFSEFCSDYLEATAKEWIQKTEYVKTKKEKATTFTVSDVVAHYKENNPRYNVTNASFTPELAFRESAQYVLDYFRDHTPKAHDEIVLYRFTNALMSACYPVHHHSVMLNKLLNCYTKNTGISI